MGLMAGLVSRLILLYWLPIRLATELFHAYVWRPRVKPAAGQNGHLNGNSSHHEFADREVDIVNMNPKKRTELNEAMDKWWGPITPLLGLKAMNKVRIPIIIQAYQKDVLNRDFDATALRANSPLMGAKVCDVGCGGGYLTEALVKVGADVVGLDDNEYDVLAAKTHWKETRGSNSPDEPKYYHASVQEFGKRHEGEFDIVVCSELIEHLDDPMGYIPHVLKLVRQGGVVIFTTNNRTLSSLCFAIGWLEHVAAIIPVNTHHLYQFIQPSEIDKVLRRNGFQTKDVIGYLPIGLTARLTWRLQWFLTSYTGVWYAQVAKKEIAN